MTVLTMIAMGKLTMAFCLLGTKTLMRMDMVVRPTEFGSVVRPLLDMF